MLLATVEYVADGVTTVFPYSFPTINHKTDVKVYLDNTEEVVGGGVVASISSSAVTFAVAPLAGSTVRIRRQTSHQVRLVDYKGGPLRKETLNLDSLQAFYMAQEALDDVTTNEEVESAAQSALAAAAQAQSAAASSLAMAEYMLPPSATDYGTTNPLTGNPMRAGAIYYNTALSLFRVFDQGAWANVSLNDPDPTPAPTPTPTPAPAPTPAGITYVTTGVDGDAALSEVFVDMSSASDSTKTTWGANLQSNIPEVWVPSREALNAMCNAYPLGTTTVLPANWNQLIIWFWIWAAQGNSAWNTRVQYGHASLWVFDLRDNTWQPFFQDMGLKGKVSTYGAPEAAGGIGSQQIRGGYYTCNPANEGYELWPVEMGNEANNFFVAANNQTLMANCGGIYAEVAARLIVDDPGQPDDRANAFFVAKCGTDVYANGFTNAQFSLRADPRGPNGRHMDGGSMRYKRITNDWKRFSYLAVGGRTANGAPYLNGTPPPWGNYNGEWAYGKAPYTKDISFWDANRPPMILPSSIPV